MEAMVKHQIRVGGLKPGETAFLKIGGDGTNITKKENATVHTVTLANSTKALQIAILSRNGPEMHGVYKLLQFIFSRVHATNSLCRSVHRSVCNNV